MHLSIFMLLATTEYISGAQPLILNSKKAPSLKSIATNKTSYLTRPDQIMTRILRRLRLGYLCKNVPFIWRHCSSSAGGTIAYKRKFQPTVAGSSTEAKFMAPER
jgi:hypothetical protein